MTKEEMNNLFDRLNSLSEDNQAFILAGLFGTIQGHAKSGNDLAASLLADIEESINRIVTREKIKTPLVEDV